MSHPIVVRDASGCEKEAHATMWVSQMTWRKWEEECQRRFRVTEGDWICVKEGLHARLKPDWFLKGGDIWIHYYLHRTTEGWERVIYLRNQFAAKDALEPMARCTLE